MTAPSESPERKRELLLAELIWGYVLSAQNFDGPATPREVQQRFAPRPAFSHDEVAGALQELIHTGRVVLSDDRHLTVLVPDTRSRDELLAARGYE